MNTRDIIRAWKDEEYRLSLSEAERALLPAHPAGFIELTDTELDVAAGGARPQPIPTYEVGCPNTRFPNVCSYATCPTRPEICLP
jgi:mersacidin/lichenicidin family type 2 lantibiotic